jgi:hypothetical protein
MTTFDDWLRQANAATDVIRERTDGDLSVIIDDCDLEDPDAEWSVAVSYEYDREIARHNDIPALLREIGTNVKERLDELASRIETIPEPDANDEPHAD